MAAALAWYLYRALLLVAPSLPQRPSDFETYYLGARAVVEGESPFAVPRFDYPPLQAFLLAPLGVDGYTVARWAWFLASHAFIAGAAWLVWKRLGADETALLAVTLVWTGGGAITENLALGQVNPLLLILVVVGWRSAGYTAPVAVGVATALKIWPAALFPAYVLSRRWNALRGGIAVAVAFVLLPLLALRAFWPPPHIPVAVGAWVGTPAVFNFSLPAVVLRILDPPVAGERLPHNWEFGNNYYELRLSPGDVAVSFAAAIAALLAGLLLLGRACGWKTPPDHEPLTLAALVSLSLLVSPLCWSHYQLLQYPGAALLLAGFLRSRNLWGAGALGVVFFCLYWGPVLGLGPYLSRYGWTAARPAALWCLTSLTPSATTALFLLYVQRLARLRRGSKM